MRMSWEREKETLGREVMCELYRCGLVRTWYRHRREGWELISGKWSPFYVQLRPLCSHPDLLARIGRAIGRLTQEEAGHITRLVGIAMAGIPISVATSLACGLPSAYTRKLEGVRTLDDLTSVISSYGEHNMLEGEVRPGDRLGFVDDLVTGLDSKLIAIEQARHHLRGQGLTDVGTDDVIVVLDREQGAAEKAVAAGLRLHRLIPFRTCGIDWLRDALAPIEYEVLCGYLADPEAYQAPDRRAEVTALAP